MDIRPGCLERIARSGSGQFATDNKFSGIDIATLNSP
jgi:hypothetical protein